MNIAMHFGSYHCLYYFYLLIPVVCFLIYRMVQHHYHRQQLVSDRYATFVLYHYGFGKEIFKNVLIFIGMIFLILALLRPQWGKQEQIVMQEGRDVIIAVDISRSMLAQDAKPNRLHFAKEKIKKLLYNLSCERVGLIVFSGSTIIQCPLTTDYAAFFLFLDQLDVDTISQGTTALDQAIKAALQVFQAIPTRKTKILVAFTDGEDFSSDLQGVKEQVVQEGLSIFTVGIGTSHGAPVPILNDQNKQIGWEKDERGHVIMSRLNENLLADVAVQSGGKYIHAVAGDDDINVLLAAINKFEKDKLEDKTMQALQEQYPYCIALSFLCFALEWIL